MVEATAPPESSRAIWSPGREVERLAALEGTRHPITVPVHDVGDAADRDGGPGLDLQRLVDRYPRRVRVDLGGLGIQDPQRKALEVYGSRAPVLDGDVLDPAAAVGEGETFEDHVQVARVVLDLHGGEVVESPGSGPAARRNPGRGW